MSLTLKLGIATIFLSVCAIIAQVFFPEIRTWLGLPNISAPIEDIIKTNSDTDDTHSAKDAHTSTNTSEIKRRTQVSKDQNNSTFIKISSEPSNAKVFGAWTYLGQTPLNLDRKRLNGILILSLDGYDPVFTEISAKTASVISISFAPSQKHAKGNLLVYDKKYSGIPSDFILEQLLSQGLFVMQEDSVKDYIRKLSAVPGGLSEESFRDYIRARYKADYIVGAVIECSETDLGDVDMGNQRTQEAAKGLKRSRCEVRFDAFALATGKTSAVVSADSQAFGDSDSNARREAGQKAAAEAARKLKNQLLM